MSPVHFYKSHTLSYLSVERIAMECGSMAHINNDQFSEFMEQSCGKSRRNTSNYHWLACWPEFYPLDVLSGLISEFGFVCLLCGGISEDCRKHSGLDHIYECKGLIPHYVMPTDSHFTLSHLRVSTARSDERYAMPALCHSCKEDWVSRWVKLKVGFNSVLEPIDMVLSKVLSFNRFRNRVLSMKKPKYRFNPWLEAPLFEPDEVIYNLIKAGLTPMTEPVPQKFESVIADAKANRLKSEIMALKQQLSGLERELAS